MSAQVSEVAKEECSLEVSGTWHTACVENKTIEVHNKCQILTNDEEGDEGECGNCKAWPVVGKGGKISKGGKVVKMERFEKVTKFQKFDKIKFADAECGEVKFVGHGVMFPSD